MLNDYQKYQNLEKARGGDRQKKAKEKARKTLKKYSTGKNKGLAQKTISDTKNLAKSISPLGFVSLLLQANLLSDWMYGLALIAAMLKDILDLSEVAGVFPFTGVFYFFVLITTFLISIFIALMMILGNLSNGSSGRKEQKMIRNWLILISGTATESVFGLNILPIETLTVLIIYALVLSARSSTKQIA